MSVKNGRVGSLSATDYSLRRTVDSHSGGYLSASRNVSARCVS